jgi:hypothetical protein
MPSPKCRQFDPCERRGTEKGKHICVMGYCANAERLWCVKKSENVQGEMPKPCGSRRDLHGRWYPSCDELRIHQLEGIRILKRYACSTCTRPAAELSKWCCSQHCPVVVVVRVVTPRQSQNIHSLCLWVRRDDLWTRHGLRIGHDI